MSWAPGTEPTREAGPASKATAHSPGSSSNSAGHYILLLPTSDTFSELQGIPACPRGQVLRMDKGECSPPPASCQACLLPTALYMALTQKLDPACPQLSPPSEAHSFDLRPVLSGWLLSHLEQFPPEGFLIQSVLLPSGLNPRMGQLMCKCRTVSKSFLLLLLLTGHFGAA